MILVGLLQYRKVEGWYKEKTSLSSSVWLQTRVIITPVQRNTLDLKIQRRKEAFRSWR